MYKFCVNRGKMYKFVEIGGNAVCIIGLGRWTPLVVCKVLHNEMWECDTG